MKILTTNYITCAVKACKTSPASFPLHFKGAELVQEELELNSDFIVNILPRIEWPALLQTAVEACAFLGFTTLPPQKPEADQLDEKMVKDLHTLLVETQVMEGKLVCGNCGHEYNIHQGIANFLLPNHLGMIPDCLGGCSGGWC
ncbi:adoMet-dependent tRNA methyltransferase complex subunit Trm112 [Trichophaea hybrida]|nr:adoMet-dependent tRNA methyltransferase complex subunit Trm112 [Trichophaea hybrida]